MPPSEYDSTTQYIAVLKQPLWKFARLKRWFGNVSFHLGGVAVMTRSLLRASREKWETSEILRQMDALGVQSISITNLTALFTGMVLALQTAYALSQFGGKLFVGRVVVLSITRELGPTLTALMVGRAGRRGHHGRARDHGRHGAGRRHARPRARRPSASSSCRGSSP